MKRMVLSILVENTAGVLSRVAGLFLVEEAIILTA